MKPQSVTCNYNDISVLELIVLDIRHKMFDIWFITHMEINICCNTSESIS